MITALDWASVWSPLEGPSSNLSASQTLIVVFLYMLLCSSSFSYISLKNTQWFLCKAKSLHEWISSTTRFWISTKSNCSIWNLEGFDHMVSCPWSTSVWVGKKSRGLLPNRMKDKKIHFLVKSWKPKTLMIAWFEGIVSWDKWFLKFFVSSMMKKPTQSFSLLRTYYFWKSFQ